MTPSSFFRMAAVTPIRYRSLDQYATGLTTDMLA